MIEIPIFTKNSIYIRTFWRNIVAVLTKINRVIAVIEKPFSPCMLDDMINSTQISNKLNEISIHQEKRSEDKIIRDDDRIRKSNLKEN